jgi:hypothetical protein
MDFHRLKTPEAKSMYLVGDGESFKNQDGEQVLIKKKEAKSTPADIMSSFGS